MVSPRTLTCALALTILSLTFTQKVIATSLPIAHGDCERTTVIQNMMRELKVSEATATRMTIQTEKRVYRNLGKSRDVLHYTSINLRNYSFTFESGPDVLVLSDELLTDINALLSLHGNRPLPARISVTELIQRRNSMGSEFPLGRLLDALSEGDPYLRAIHRSFGYDFRFSPDRLMQELGELRLQRAISREEAEYLRELIAKLDTDQEFQLAVTLRARLVDYFARDTLTHAEVSEVSETLTLTDLLGDTFPGSPRLQTRLTESLTASFFEDPIAHWRKIKKRSRLISPRELPSNPVWRDFLSKLDDPREVEYLLQSGKLSVSERIALLAHQRAPFTHTLELFAKEIEEVLSSDKQRVLEAVKLPKRDYSFATVTELPYPGLHFANKEAVSDFVTQLMATDPGYRYIPKIEKDLNRGGYQFRHVVRVSDTPDFMDHPPEILRGEILLKAKPLKKVLPPSAFQAGPTFLQWGMLPQRHIQGFKLHVSATPEELERVATLVIPILVEARVTFKVVKDEGTLLKLGLDSQAGKAITIYPRNQTEAIQLSRRIDSLLLNQRVTPFRIQAERQVGRSGNVFTRYGAFNSNFLKTPSGEAVPELRGIQWKPDWIKTDPFSEQGL